MSSSHLEMSKMISACACCNLPIWKCPRSYPHCEVLSFPSVSILDESGSEQDASALVGCVFPILKSPRYHPRDVHRLCLIRVNMFCYSHLVANKIIYARSGCVLPFWKHPRNHPHTHIVFFPSECIQHVIRMSRFPSGSEKDNNCTSRMYSSDLKNFQDDIQIYMLGYSLLKASKKKYAWVWWCFLQIWKP